MPPNHVIESAKPNPFMIRNPLYRKPKKSKMMAGSIDKILKIKAEEKRYRSCKFI